MFGRFSAELFEQLPGWRERLHEDPQNLDEIELEGLSTRLPDRLSVD